MHIKRRMVLHNRMARIVPSLRSAAELYTFAQDINDLAFPFITPLGT